MLGVCALVLAVSACGSAGGDGEGSTYGHSVMHESVLNAVFVGTAVDTRNIEQATVRVNEVLWERLEFRGATGGVYAFVPLPIGGEVPVQGGLGKLKEGADYTFVGVQVLFSDPPHWFVSTAYDSEMREMLGEIGPPLEVILHADETSAAAKREALVEYVIEGTAWADERRAGEPDPPVGPRLALALAYIEPPVTSEAVDPELGMTVTDYLALDARDRQLLELPAMPAEVVEALDLVSVQVLVILAPGPADAYWGLGIRTRAGTLGPFGFSPEEKLVIIMGAAPRRGEVELVGWAKPGATATWTMRDAVSLAGLDAAATRVEVSQVDLSPGYADVVVFDLTDRSVRVVDYRTATDLVARYTRPVGVGEGGGS